MGIDISLNPITRKTFTNVLLFLVGMKYEQFRFRLFDFMK